MRDADTTFGGGAGDFPATTWGAVARARGGEGLAELCQRFWTPVYRFVRIAWKKSNEDAKDLTQAFFLWLMEGDALQKYEPSRGGFRAYVKLLLRSFVATRAISESRIKRGGGARLVPIEDNVAIDTDDPEKALDQAWRAAVLQSAIERMRRRLADKPMVRQAFEAYDLADKPRTYEEVAGALGIKESDVRNHLVAARELLRQEILRELADTVDGDPEEELRALFG